MMIYIYASPNLWFSFSTLVSSKNTILYVLFVMYAVGYSLYRWLKMTDLSKDAYFISEITQSYIIINV